MPVVSRTCADYGPAHEHGSRATRPCARANCRAVATACAAGGWAAVRLAAARAATPQCDRGVLPKPWGKVSMLYGSVSVLCGWAVCRATTLRRHSVHAQRIIRSTKDVWPQLRIVSQHQAHMSGISCPLQALTAGPATAFHSQQTQAAPAILAAQEHLELLRRMMGEIHTPHTADDRAPLVRGAQTGVAACKQGVGLALHLWCMSAELDTCCSQQWPRRTIHHVRKLQASSQHMTVL
jgi:hypothetical protein